MSRSTDGTPGLPRLDGQVVVVTGGSTGIGYFVCEQLASLGAHVVVASRDPGRTADAVRSIREHVLDARVGSQHVDLSDLDSVAAAAEELQRLPRLDAVVANAAIVGLPAWSVPRDERARPRTRTRQGHELHWGTNHLGHFALLARLVPAVLDTGGRVVHVGSIVHTRVREPADAVPHPDEPQSALTRYARSKLAVMSFGFELARRLEAAGSPASSVVAHPGTAVDVMSPPRRISTNQPSVGVASRMLVRTFAQGKHVAAESVVTALASPGVRNGDYWGPDGFQQLRGVPSRHAAGSAALDPEAAARLVEVSERLTGVRLPV